jgi:hypothetical protein
MPLNNLARARDSVDLTVIGQQAEVPDAFTNPSRILNQDINQQLKSSEVANYNRMKRLFPDRQIMHTETVSLQD